MEADPYAIALAKSARSPYKKDLTTSIRTNRSKLGTLFFDLLVKQLIQVDTSYPPSDIASLVLILQRIQESGTKELHKQCLNFYLFLDFRDSSVAPGAELQKNELPGFYASEIDMPTGYRELIHGLWLLDRLAFDDALVRLCHPEVSSHFSDEIIAAYMAHAPQETKARSVLAYVNANSPSLSKPETLKYYVNVLCDANLFAALEFLRAASDDTKLELMNQIVEFALTHEPKKNVWRLANLPLSERESRLLNEEVLYPIAGGNSPQAAIAKDVLLMRSLHLGDKELAYKVAPMGSDGGKAGPVAWSDLARGLQLAKSSS